MFRALNLEFIALLGCYATYVGTFYRSFGTAYRFNLQGSSSPKTMPGNMRIRYYVGDDMCCDGSQ